MHFNSDELEVFAGLESEHEGRLTHKPPPRTLYDTAYKERWFKLKANLLFYYRLNEYGGVEKNEPSGVFVLENIEVQREEFSEAPFGFAIKWKDDLERKHLFFAQSETSAFTWVNKLINASYENMRAQMVKLRIEIRRKTGKDPLEHLGTPLPLRASRSLTLHASQFHVDLEKHDLPQEFAEDSLVQSSSSDDYPRSRRSPSSLSLKSPSIKIKVPKSPSLRQPVRTAPVPPPRKGKKQNAGNGQMVVDDLVPGVGGSTASFKCHIEDECFPKKQDNLLD